MADIDPSVQDSVNKVLTKNPNSFVRVEDPDTGNVYNKPLRQVDITKDHAYGVNATPDYEEYGNWATATKTAGRAFTNELTLGFYQQLMDKYRTPEEREAIKKENEFNELPKFVGEVGAWAVPGIAEIKALGHASDALKVVGAVPGAGNLLAKTVFHAEGQAFQRILTENAIAGGQMAFTQANVDASLNGNSKEALEALFLAPAIGIAGGVALGTLFGGLHNMLTPGAKDMGKTIKAGEDVVYDPQGFSGAQTTPEQVAKNAATMQKIDQSRQILQAIPNKTPQEIIEHDFLTQYMETAAKDEKFRKTWQDLGTVDLEQHFRDQQIIQEASLAEGEVWPAQKVATKMGDIINGSIDRLVGLRKAVSEVDNPMMKLSDGTMVPKTDGMFVAMDKNMTDNQKYSLFTNTLVGESSALGQLDKVFTLSRRAIAKDVAQKFFEQTGEQISRKDLMDGIRAAEMRGASKRVFVTAKKLYTKAKLSAGITRNVVGKTPMKPSEVYTFFNSLRKSFDDIGYKPGFLERPQDLTLMQDLQKIVKGVFENTENFGKIGADRAAAATAMGELNGAFNGLKDFFTSPLRGRLGKPASRIHANRFRPLGQYSDTAGAPALRDFDAVMDKFYGTLNEKSEQIGRLLGIDTATIRGPIDQELAQLKKYWTWQKAMKTNSARDFRTFYARGKEAVSEAANWGNPAMGPITRVVRGLEDLFSGSYRYAKYEMMRLGVDSMVKILSGFKNTKSYKEWYIQRLEFLRHMDNKAAKTQGRMKGIVSTLASSGKRAGADMSKAVPFQLMHNMTTGKEQIDRDFKRVSKSIGDKVNDPQQLYALQKQLAPLSNIAPQADQEIGMKMLAKLGQMAQQIPKGPPAEYGIEGPSTIEKAEFLDGVTAMSDPEKMFDLIENGTATPAMTQLFAQSFPNYWQGLQSEAVGAILTTPDMPIEGRGRLMRSFGITTMPMPIPGLATPGSNGTVPVAPQPEPASMGQSQDRPRKVTGMKLSTPSEMYGTFNQNGGTGTR